MSPVIKRSRRPLILIINYIIYATGAGWLACYMYVANYGGTMPPRGSFYSFLADSWIFLTTGFLAPIIATLVTGYILKKRGRSTDGR